MKILISLLCLLLLAVPVLAQDSDLSQTFTFDSGTTFDYPEDGLAEASQDSDDVAFVDVGEDVFFTIVDSGFFAEEGFTVGDELTGVLDWYIDWLFEGDVEFVEDDVELVEVGGREAALLSYDDGFGSQMLFMRLDDGGIRAVNAAADERDFTEEDLLLAIGESFRTGEAAGCVVGTGEANTVQMRVGPGVNRAVFAFLPANRDFTPLGRAEAGDGSQWFQMDKAEVAPNAAASEAWVAVGDVDAVGDCDRLGEADAPPIVPMIPAVPSSDDGGGGESDSSASTTEGGSIAPAAGTWTIHYGSAGKGSCLDAPDFTFDLNIDWESDVVNLSYNGSSVVLGGNRLDQVQPNVYSGVFNVPNGNAFQLVLRPVSSTQFTGEAILTGVVEGHTCSNTVAVTVTRN